MNNFIKIVISITLIGTVVGTFYWFQWRPTEIRKNCHSYAIQKADKDDGNVDNLFEDDNYNFRLQYCLNREGLK